MTHQLGIPDGNFVIMCTDMSLEEFISLYAQLFMNTDNVQEVVERVIKTVSLWKDVFVSHYGGIFSQHLVYMLSLYVYTDLIKISKAFLKILRILPSFYSLLLSCINLTYLYLLLHSQIFLL